MKIIIEQAKDELFMSTALNTVKRVLEDSGFLIESINYDEGWIRTVKNQIEWPFKKEQQGGEYPTWEVKEKGSLHYKGGAIEPIDLYSSGKMLRDFALCSIIKYAYRNRLSFNKDVNKDDLQKIIHYCEILMKES